jgi:NAD(P)-dependent dehydrogenase (short-subunit alcohol dehydrogenase family)
MNRFDGKVAVVTGGNSGIGLATAKAFAREGASVAITGRDEASLKKAEGEIGAGTLVLRADASRVAELNMAMGKIAERFKRIDALFVNAGIAKLLPFDQVTEASFDESVAVNFKGVFFTVQKALPLLGPGSAVVINASINAHKGMPGTTVYGATKAAVISLAKTMSADLASRGIRVNAISPGPVESALLTRGHMSESELKQTKDWIQNQVLIKRFAKADEIAEAVLYLCSSASSYVVGSELIIDGGMTL